MKEGNIAKAPLKTSIVFGRRVWLLTASTRSLFFLRKLLFLFYIHFWNVMKKISLSIFFSVLSSLIIVFFLGFSLTKRKELELEQALLKKSLKLDSVLHTKQVEKKFRFLEREKKKILLQKKILPASPFFALIVMDNKSKVQQIYLSKNQFWPKALRLQKKDRLKKRARSSLLKRKRKLIQFSKKLVFQKVGGKRSIKRFRFFEKKQDLTLFIQSLDKRTQSFAFLKEDNSFFKFQQVGVRKRGEDKEIFTMDSKGRLFFHNKRYKIFKTLPKTSLLWKSLKDSTKASSFKWYLTVDKKAGKKEMYYIQKGFEGSWFLVAKSNWVSPFFIFERLSSQHFSVLFVVLFLFLAFFCLKLFSLISAYKFLRFAFLSFDKTSIFPVSINKKHPLLYFYNNRQFFLNQRKKEEQEDLVEERNLNFQEIVVQEVQKLKSKFPRLSVNEKFEFDVKVFGFERFLRTIIHELLLNGLEAMGGLKDPKLELSIKESEDYLVFCIKDYGVGIPEKNYEKIFRAYYSTKSQMGVGLSLVQSVVQSNDGKIELSSPENGGVQVCVYLPLKCFLKNHSQK